MAIETVIDNEPATDVVSSKKPPPLYAILRDGTTSPEVFHAATDEEALQRIKKMVRLGDCKSMYLYKLFAAEIYVSSSVCKVGSELETFISVSSTQSLESFTNK